MTARVYVKHFDRNSTDFPDGSDGQDDWQMTQGGFRTEWQPTSDNNFTLQGDLYHGIKNSQLFLASTNPPTFREIVQDDATLSGGNILGKFTHQLGNGGDVQIQMYYDRTEREIPLTFQEDRDTFDVDFQHHLPWGERQDLTWGLGYRVTSDHVDNGLFVTFDPDDRATQLFSTFLQDEIVLVPERLKLTLGAKLEHNDYSDFEFQPNARLLWKIAEKQSAWAAVSRAVRTPTRFDSDLQLDFLFPPAPTRLILVGNHDFKSEEVIAYELGYRVEPLDWLSLDAATFYNVYDNQQSLEGDPPLDLANLPTTPSTIELRYANEVDGEAYGLELGSVVKASDWWTIRTAYTFLRENLHTGESSSDTTSEAAEGNNPQHQVYARSSMDLAHNVTLDLGFRYVDTLPNQSAPAYLLGEARVGWDVTDDLELALVGQNLLDNQHPEYGSEATQREIPDGVYAKATYRW